MIDDPKRYKSIAYHTKVIGNRWNYFFEKMYPSSSQCRYWTFKNEQEIAALRLKHNQEFQKYHGDRLGLNVSLFCQNNFHLP